MSGPVRFAYVVIASERRADPDVDLSHAPSAPKIGDIQVFPTQRGIRVIDEQGYGKGVPVVDIVHLHYVCEGRELPTGDIDFEYESRRLLSLIAIGANNERSVHHVIDEVFEKVEEFIDRLDSIDGWGEALGRLRKEFP